MNVFIKSFLKNYIKFLLLFSLPAFIDFLPGENFYSIDVFLATLFTLFVAFSLVTLRLSLNLIKQLGKESINSLFFAVPFSVFYFPHTLGILFVGDNFSRSGYEDVSRYQILESGLHYLVAYLIFLLFIYILLEE